MFIPGAGNGQGYTTKFWSETTESTAPEAEAAAVGTEQGKEAAGGEASPPPAVGKPAESGSPGGGDWRDKRIAKLTARLRETEARVAAAPGPEAPPTVPVVPDAEIDRRAAQLAAANEFNRECNEVARAGAEAFPDFGTRISELTKLVDREDRGSVEAYNQFLAAAIETGEAPALLHRLGGDLNEAARILALSPAKMGVALAKLGVRPAAAPTTAAPKPITPVGRRGTDTAIDPRDTGSSDRMTTAEWMRAREAQVAQRAAKRA